MIFAAWLLAVLYFPDVTTETYDPRLQDLNVCLEQIKDSKKWPIERMDPTLKKPVMRPLFIGCYDDKQFKDEYTKFEKAASKIGPDNKWWIVRVSTGTNDIGFAGQGPYTLEGCLADFYELQTGGDTILAGCVTDSVRNILADITYHRFVDNHNKQ